MYERIINMIIVFTLSIMSFMLVLFGFDWIYQLWLAEEFNGWVVPFVAIPVVALMSALLIYLFCNALSKEEDGVADHY